MPDIWTQHPEKLRWMLSEAGIECGKEARILKPRDTAWTCHINRPDWYGDIYIHDFKKFWQNDLISSLILACAVSALTIGYLIGKRSKTNFK